MTEQNDNLMPLRPEDFQELKNELKREGKKQGVVIKTLNLTTYPWRQLRQRYHIRYRFNPKHLAMDLAILATVVILILANIFYWQGGVHYFTDELDLKIHTQDQQVVSGERTVFVVDYSNNNQFALHLVSATIKLPDNFELQEVSRTDYNWQDNTLYLGDLQAGANGRFILVGDYLGDLDQQDKIVVNFNYFKSNKQGLRLWGQFQKTESFVFTPMSSVITTEIALPERLVSGQEFLLPISITNNADFGFKEIKLEPIISPNVAIINGSESYIENAWYFYQVAPGQTINITPKIKITSAELSEGLIFNTFVKQHDLYLKQGVISERQTIFSSNFSVNALVDRYAVNAQDWVTVSILLNNQGEFDLENMKLKLDFQGGAWDLSAIDGPKGEPTGQSLTWTAVDYPQLALLKPGEQNRVDLRIKTKVIAGQINPQLKVTASVVYHIDNLPAVYTAKEVAIKVNSNLNVKSFARYYSPQGDQLGRGPLPPIAGEQTKYWVFLQVLNDLNAMEHVRLTASLPSNVQWQSKTSVPIGQAIDFNPQTKQLSWSIEDVNIAPKNIGIAFEVGLTPSQAQKGQYATLIENISITGQDTFTGRLINRPVSDVTTELIFDDQGALKGGIVK